MRTGSGQEARLQLEVQRPTKRRTTDERMKKTETKKQVTAAIQACLEKKAEELSILEMEKGSGAFTDYFVFGDTAAIQPVCDALE